MAPTPVFLPGKYHGQTSLVGYSPWGCKELETTEVTESFPGGTSGKEPTFQCMRLKKYWFDPWVRKIPWRMAWLIPGSGRSLGGWHGHPLQYSCLENPTDRGAWQATVHRVAKSQTRLK